MKKPKVLFFDIETFPLVTESWGVYEQNALRVLRHMELASVAYKWQGTKNVICITRQGQKTDKELAKKIHALLSTADVVVAHNGDSYDNKKLRARFIHHDLPPTPPYKQIDTKKLAKAQFGFASNKLNELGLYLGVGKKERTGGYDLWIDCMEDKPAAWKRMITYNKKDVVLLEKVYNKFAPWSVLPNMALMSQRPEACPKCGKGPMHSRGFNYTRTSVFRTYQCQACKGWTTARAAERDTKALYK